MATLTSKTPIKNSVVETSTTALEIRLLKAIERDDIKAFDAMIDETHAGKCRLGRFPVLSLMYLYSSRKLIAAYEEEFLKITSWDAYSEPAELSRFFSKKAGKCLRLYFDEIVSPLEMLLILDRTSKVKKLYSYVRPSEAVKSRIKSIYYIKYAAKVTFRGKTAEFEKRPLTRSEKRRIVNVCLCCILALAVIVATPVTAAALAPRHVEGEVTSFEQMDFESNETYTLKADITVPEDCSISSFSCSVVGEGHKIILPKNVTLGELDGKISDVVFQTDGTPIFTQCTNRAQLVDITVNAEVDKEISESHAFVALENYGLIERATVNVAGSIKAVGKLNEDGESAGVDVILGGIAVENSYSTNSRAQRVYGFIRNCEVNFSDFELSGDPAANASFGGIVGINNAVVQTSVVTGDVTSDMFDLAGVCYANGYALSEVDSKVNLTQITSVEGWTSIVSGIVIENGGLTEKCMTSGALYAEGVDSAICGGIAGRTYGSIEYCMFDGSVTALAKSVYAGGIFARSEIVRSGLSLYLGITLNCLSKGTISIIGAQETSCVGGIGGLIMEFDSYDLEGNIIPWGGAVTDCIFMGGIDGKCDYTGSVVGVVGAGVYEVNTYTDSRGLSTPYFDGNLYLIRENGLPVFGATVTTSGEGDDTVEVFNTEIVGKGAAAATQTEIENGELYKDILAALGI